MAESEAHQDEIFGGPTKRFFVSMLPRDIGLADAILDLIDNCIDGAMRREKANLSKAAPFKKYHAHLTLSKNGFEISDNCGGIPEDSIEAAFTLGRPVVDKDADLPTIGMYGIGMKRAVFKIGNEALVQSNSDEGFFEVEYSKEWLNPENDNWDLPITKLEEKPGDRGVTISITDVRAEIGKNFENESFVNTLKSQISEHFGYIMQRGFTIKIDGNEIAPRTLQLLSSKHSSAEGIRPYDYETKVSGVEIKVIVGLFRSLAKESEIEEELYGSTETDTAGVSVVCNDRVILFSDRTMKVGWGDGGVPKYHPQFRSIAGLIAFTSQSAEMLPISTTKRDLDVGSDVYLKARKAVMEGLKTFTSFTNKWKGMESEVAVLIDESEHSDAKAEVSLAREYGRSVRGEQQSRRYQPVLPVPKNKNPMRRISFSREKKQVERVAQHLFGETGVHPSDVGSECFDRTLAEAKGR